jgi:alpha-beta hydrolase superfamily lysophospholipase
MNVAAATLRRSGMRRPWGRAAVITLALVAIAYGAIVAWFYARQEAMIFRAAPLPANHRFDLPDVHEVSIPVDGATLSALHLKLPRPRGVVFFLHGSSGNLATWLTSTEYYRAANYDLFMLDYRGFGKSSGRIESEAQLRADVRAAWATVAPQYVGLRKVIYGRSLGTGLAAGLAAEFGADLTILVSPYCSVTQLVEADYPFLPIATLKYRLDTCADIARVKTPVLLVHGTDDAKIPFSHSEQLHAKAPQARLLPIRGAGHGNVHRFPEYNDALVGALKAL